jgi:uncharacterized protein (TIGR03435 family)
MALFVSNWTDRPVLDRTGLKDSTCWTPMPMQPRDPSACNSNNEAWELADSSRASIFLVFARMGLRLEPQKAPLES